MAGVLAALSSAKLLGPIIGLTATFAVGFGAAEVYEHKVPWGLSAQIAKADKLNATAETTGYAAGVDYQSKADAAAFANWAADLTKCQSDLVDARNAQANAITAAEKNSSVQASAAYKLGRATCENPNAKAAPGAPVPPGGVPNADTDFSTVFGAPAPAAGP